MATRIKTVLVALIALVAIGITNTGETKKVATIFDFLGGLFDGSSANNLTNSFQAGAGQAQPTSSPSITAVQGVQSPAPSPLYFDTNSGTVNDASTGQPTTATGDPYVNSGPTQAQIAIQNQQNNARNSFNQGRSNIMSDIQNSAGNYLQTGRNNILDFLDSLKTQQQGLDTQRANAVLGQRNASKGIMNMVGQGIRSFGVNLANRNAGDSSAALAGAQAYGRMGNQQMQDVNQQLGLENANIDVAQQGLNTSRESGRRKLETEKAQTINNLTNYAQQQFATLNAQAEGAGIMDRIAIEQEKENVKNQLIQQLAELDAKLGESNTINPMDQMAVQNKAQELSQLGQGGTQFDFTTSAPTQLQTGAQLGQLPIFSNRRKRA